MATSKPSPQPAPSKPPSRTQSKAKAAGIVAAGGGPEDPLADLAAVKSMRADKKARKAAKGSGGGGIPGGNKLLLAEFTACFVVLGLGTIVAPSGSKDGVPRLMSRGSGLCLLFFILALVSGTGEAGRKAAAGLGGLVTVAYLVTSSDAHNVFAWISQYYSTAGVQAGEAFGTGSADIAAELSSQQAANTGTSTGGAAEQAGSAAASAIGAAE